MLLLSLLVETGHRPGAGLTQADKTYIQLNFYLDILRGAPGFQGGAKALDATLQRNQLKVGKPLIVTILTENVSLRSYCTFSYLLRAHIRNINMRRYILVHVDMN